MSKNNKRLIPDKYVGEMKIDGNWGWGNSSLTSPMELYPETMWSNSKKPAWIQYFPKIDAVGKVRISAYIIGFSKNQDTNMEYEIHHADGITKIYVDSSKYSDGESDWLVLGTYPFNGNGNEYVQLNHNSSDYTTRASTIRFEIINDALGDVWQYLYMGPTKVQPEYSDIVSLNKFSDLNTCKYKKEIEKMHFLGFLDTDGDLFKPSDTITENTFLNWLSRVCDLEPQSSSQNPISLEAAAEKIVETIKKLDINLEWIEKSSHNISFLKNAHLFDRYPEIENISGDFTRAQAAVLLFCVYHTFIASGVAESKWKLKFCDDFDGDSLDENIWEFENRAPAHILSSRWAKNVTVKNSIMSLKTKKEKIEAYPDKDWTTASVWVKPDYFKQYGGYWQASIKINAAKGINNAFWMIGNGNEIDIVEGHYTNSVHTNYHFEGVQYSENYSAPFDLSEDFHIYALEWTENELIYFFDGKEISRKRNIDAHFPLYPIFSTAVINWAGKIPDSADGASMDVEWVRVYNKK